MCAPDDPPRSLRSIPKRRCRVPRWPSAAARPRPSKEQVTQPLTEDTRTLRPHETPARQPQPEAAAVPDPTGDSTNNPTSFFAPAEPAAHQETSRFANTTILLVDDDPDIRALTRTFLEHIGFRVLTSGDADRAVQIFLGAQHVNLLIADQNMPGR
jgi:PleD family two-component response regulator